MSTAGRAITAALLLSLPAMFATNAAGAAGDAQLAARYAPVFKFDKNERYWPISVRTFIQHSSLKFVQGVGAIGPGACPEKTIAGPGAPKDKDNPVKPSRLGVYTGKPYTARKSYRRVGHPIQRAVCKPDYGPTYRAPQFTRPLDTSLKRPTKLDKRFGFVLDLRNAKRGAFGKPSDAKTPLYYRVRAAPGGGHFIRYFLMYTCSGLGVRSNFLNEGHTSPTGGVAKKCAHEGEWEGLSVYVPKDSSKPLEVFYNQHFDGTRVIGDWNVVKDGSRPVGYVARITHATYQYPGERVSHDGSGKDLGYDDASGDGVVWRPGNLVNVVDEPWYGFGGAWGDVGKIAALTGPLGPGPGWNIRAAGFPSPYFWNPPAFPAQAIRWCNIAAYPNTDLQCVRPLHDKATHLSGHSLIDLDLDCPGPSGEPQLPNHFIGVTVHPPYPDQHNLDGDRDGIGCEVERAKPALWGWLSNPHGVSLTGHGNSAPGVISYFHYPQGDEIQCQTPSPFRFDLTLPGGPADLDDGLISYHGAASGGAADRPAAQFDVELQRQDENHWIGTFHANLPKYHGCAAADRYDTGVLAVDLAGY